MASARVRRRRPGWPGRILLAAALTGVLGGNAMIWQASAAAFSATAANPVNSWTAGLVSLTDDDAGAAMFTATGLKPGTTGQKCIKVTYAGNLTAGEVKVYAAAATGTLASYVSLTVDMGAVGTSASCGAFAAASTPINGVLLSTVATKTDYSNGYSTGWSPTVGDFRVFRFTYTLSASTPDVRQAAACAIPFIWETRDT
jgi:hypothetical protein